MTKMFRSTEVSEDDHSATLRLDGKLIEPWVSELERLCLHYKNGKNKTVVLDFAGVTFIDDKGVKMLERIKDDKIKIINCSIFIQHVLRKIVTEDE